MPVKPLLFLFGSETGTAQDAAEELWLEAKQKKIPSKLLSLEDYCITVSFIFVRFVGVFYFFLPD